MAASTYLEIESFVSKFNFLTSLGYSADLRFTNLHGTINVEFKASLGCLNLNQEAFQHMKPSRIRRRLRRKEKRDKYRNSSTDTSESNIDLIQPRTLEDQKLDLESNLHQFNAENVCDVAVQTTNDYQVDAVVPANIAIPPQCIPQKSVYQDYADNVVDGLKQVEACTRQVLPDEQFGLNFYYDKDRIPRNPSLASAFPDVPAQQPFPKVRNFTEEEFKRMLRGYGMKKTHQFANIHQNNS